MLHQSPRFHHSPTPRLRSLGSQTSAEILQSLRLKKIYPQLGLTEHRLQQSTTLYTQAMDFDSQRCLHLRFQHHGAVKGGGMLSPHLSLQSQQRRLSGKRLLQESKARMLCQYSKKLVPWGTRTMESSSPTGVPMTTSCAQLQLLDPMYSHLSTRSRYRNELIPLPEHWIRTPRKSTFTEYRVLARPLHTTMRTDISRVYVARAHREL